MKNFIQLHFEVKLGGVLLAAALFGAALTFAMRKPPAAAKPKPEEVPPKPSTPYKPPRTVTPPVDPIPRQPHVRQPHVRQQHVRQSTFEQEVLKAQRAGEAAASPFFGRAAKIRAERETQS